MPEFNQKEDFLYGSIQNRKNKRLHRNVKSSFEKHGFIVKGKRTFILDAIFTGNLEFHNFYIRAVKFSISYYL